ncbi:MAG: SDR family NAD(P)-dependent oxidoreductase [Planctomycetota bacterium]
MPDGLGGKRCVVTGGGSGIGAAIAKCLGRDGATVVILGRRESRLEATASALRERGAVISWRSADVTEEVGIREVFDEIAAELVGIDVLVNCAGVGGPNACALDGPDRWSEIVRTNLDGTYFTVRAALPHLRNDGRIVNISSVLGRFGVPGYTAYCASKHGVIGFTKALALELAPRGITVNAVCPGWTDTDMAREGIQALADAAGVSFEDARAKALAAVPLGRMLEPEEIGELVAWLCSPSASGMTGQAISYCGGQVMW